MDRARAVFRDAVDEPLAVDKQAFGAAELERAFAVLQPLDTARLVGPGARSVDVGRPEQITAAAARAFDRIGPKRDHDRAVGLAHAAPARTRILDPNAARFEGTRARHQVPRFRGAAGFTRGRSALAAPLQVRRPSAIQTQRASKARVRGTKCRGFVVLPALRAAGVRSRRFASASLHSAATPLSFRRSAFSRSCLMSWMLSCAMRSAVQSSERSLRKAALRATFMLGARRRRRAGDAEPRLRYGPIAPNTPRRSSPRAARASLRRPPMRGPCRSEILRRRRGARRVGNAGALRRRATAGSTGASCNPSRPRARPSPRWRTRPRRHGRARRCGFARGVW